MDDMTKQLRKAIEPMWAAETQLEMARQVAYTAIRKAAAAGMTLRAIGQVTELSHQRIDQIVKSGNV